MAGSLASINIKFFADLKQFSSNMQNANRKIVKMGKSMQKVGKNLTVGLTLPIVALGAASVKTFADFEQAMAKVKAISGATATEFKSLNDSALLLGRTTRFTASQVAELQLAYSKLGFNPDEINKVTEATLNLALATGEDLAQSATVAASTLRGFELDASEMARVVDVMASSFSNSALDLEKFKTAMATLAPVARNAGVSLEQATGYLSILVDRGVDASTAGTGLRNMFLNLAKSGQTLDEALQEINQSTNKNATSLRLFGKRGATVATIMANNTKEAKRLSISYNAAGGTAKRMAKIMDNTLQGSLFKLKSAFEGLQIALGDQLKNAVTKLASFLSTLANRFTDLEPATKKIIVVVAALAAAIGPLLVTFGFLMTTVLPGLVTAFGFFKVATIAASGAFKIFTATLLANPITAIAVALAAVISYFVFFNNATEKAVKTQSLLADVTDAAAKSIAGEKAKIVELLAVAQHEGVSKAHRLKAIRALNKISPEYLGHLTLETINTDAARVAVEKYNIALLQTAKVKAAQNKLQEIQAKKIDLELAATKRIIADAAKLLELKKNAVTVQERLRVKQLEMVGFGKITNILIDSKLKKLEEEEALILKIILANKLNNTVVASGNNTPTGGRATPVLTGTTSTELAPLTPMTSPFDGMVEGLPNGYAAFEETAAQYEERMQSLQTVAEAVGGAVAGAFDSFANSFVSSLKLANKGLAGFVKVMMRTVIKLISMMLAQSISQAITGGSAAGLATGPAAPFTTPAFIATAVGGVLAAFAAIPKFADGGIVGGSSFYGDKLFARVNSGEAIFNEKQQKRLYDLTGGGSNNIHITIDGKLTGDGRELIGVINKSTTQLNRLR